MYALRMAKFEGDRNTDRPKQKQKTHHDISPKPEVQSRDMIAHTLDIAWGT